MALTQRELCSNHRHRPVVSSYVTLLLFPYHLCLSRCIYNNNNAFICLFVLTHGVYLVFDLLEIVTGLDRGRGTTRK